MISKNCSKLSAIDNVRDDLNEIATLVRLYLFNKYQSIKVLHTNLASEKAQALLLLHYPPLFDNAIFVQDADEIYVWRYIIVGTED